MHNPTKTTDTDDECCGWPEMGGPCPECRDPEVLEWWRKRCERLNAEGAKNAE